MASTASLLSALRIATGLGLLIAPRTFLTIAHIPGATAASGIVGMRLAGARDLAIGGILWQALRKYNATTAVAGSLDGKDGGVSMPLMGADTDKKSDAAGEMVRWSLALGVAVDAMDVLSCLACWLEGGIDGWVAEGCGSAAAAVVGMGVYSYVSGPWAGGKGQS